MNERDETLEIFFAETEDLIKTSEESLLRLESAPGTGPALEELFRAVHTFKSGSAMVGFDQISEYTHLLENLLDRLRDGKVPITKPLISFLLEAIDFIRNTVDNCARGDTNIEPKVLETKKAQVNRFLGLEGIPHEDAGLPETITDIPVEAPKWYYYNIDLIFRKNLFESGIDPLLLLLSLKEMGEFVDVVSDISELPRYEKIDIYKLYISWRIILKSTAPFQEIENVFMFVKDDNNIEIKEITDRYKDGIDLKAGKMPIGEALIEKKDISKNDLDNALKKQKKIGEILVEEKKLDKKTLQTAITMQEESRAVYRKTSIRVDVTKINCLVNLAEEVGVGLSKMQSILSDRETVNILDIEQELENLLKINREFQERVAQVRMFSLEGTFQRFQRIARDTALDQHKKIKAIMSGTETELDKEVIECITDPLKHLVRNCVDHGIESPEERIAKGKSAEGTIEFKAYQKGGQIFVQIRDDGRGLNIEKIRQRALEMGIEVPDDEIDNKTLANIICNPGFSTKANVTKLSGRGVGMDVVKTAVENLGGFLKIETAKDKGTTFTLALPLTFALTDALHFKEKDMSFLVPLWGLVGTEKFDQSNMRSFGGNEKLYRFRNVYLPIMDLSRVYGSEMSNINNQGKVLVFLDTGRQEFGLLVDEVLDCKQIVVKSLESHYRNVRGISGATIMGDGSVALVLDLFDLEEIFFNKNLI